MQIISVGQNVVIDASNSPHLKQPKYFGKVVGIRENCYIVSVYLEYKIVQVKFKMQNGKSLEMEKLSTLSKSSRKYYYRGLQIMNFINVLNNEVRDFKDF